MKHYPETELDIRYVYSYMIDYSYKYEDNQWFYKNKKNDKWKCVSNMDWILFLNDCGIK